MRMGTVFHPCGGQSLWIHQPSLRSSTLGSGAQQAPSIPLQPPKRQRPLNWPPDSRLQRRAFVWHLWGGIDDWLHLCVCEHANLEALHYSTMTGQPCCMTTCHWGDVALLFEWTCALSFCCIWMYDRRHLPYCTIALYHGFSVRFLSWTQAIHS